LVSALFFKTEAKIAFFDLLRCSLPTLRLNGTDGPNSQGLANRCRVPEFFGDCTSFINTGRTYMLWVISGFKSADLAQWDAETGLAEAAE
jgi:hypothetical protein